MVSGEWVDVRKVDELGFRTRMEQGWGSEFVWMGLVGRMWRGTII
jgi:hypothetical protein